MSLSVYIFEDPSYVKLFPLAYTRPVYDLRCGMLTLREKIARAYPRGRIVLLCRPYLAEVVKEQNPGFLINEFVGGESLLINGRVLVDATFRTSIRPTGNDTMYLCGDVVVAVRLRATEDQASRLVEGFDIDQFEHCAKEQIPARLVEYPWDLVHTNGEELVRDVAPLFAKKNPISTSKYPGVHFVNKKAIRLANDVVLKPGVVLDAESGPIVIDDGVRILANSVIEGPVYIGKGTTIKAGAKIYGNTSIGSVCKIGGEVEASIIHSYSNKQHDGFLGHSYLGMWCNLGADTNTSDLKNNYRSVQAYNNGKMVDTGRQFLGLIMGDHSKTSINTMFNTGSVVGVSANVFGAGFPPKHVPSFSWGGSDGLVTYQLEKAVEVARLVMARRSKNLTATEAKLLQKVFELTRKEREER